VGGASYSFQQGPDGQQYAIGGEVSVNLSTAGSSPEAVIAKMAQVRAAALAPADPSPQDFSVAATADAIAASAREELLAQERQAAEERQSADQDPPELTDTTTDSSDAATVTIDLLGPNPQHAHALAAYQSAQQQPYQVGLNLVG
jgi:hypothetical protein